MTQESESDEETAQRLLCQFTDMEQVIGVCSHPRRASVGPAGSLSLITWRRSVSAARWNSTNLGVLLRLQMRIQTASYAAKSTPTTLQTSLPDFRQTFLHTGYATTEGLHSSVRRRIRVGSAAVLSRERCILHCRRTFLQAKFYRTANNTGEDRCVLACVSDASLYGRSCTWPNCVSEVRWEYRLGSCIVDTSPVRSFHALQSGLKALWVS